MVFIINGEINSGKTSKLSEFFNNQETTDGYLLLKAYQKNQYIGQDILWLAKNISCPFSRLENLLPVDWIEQERYREYSFSKKGLELMADVYKALIKNGTRTALIDDIGPLELLGGGAACLFSELLNIAAKIYVTVRRECLIEVLNYFNINEYNIINI